MEKVRSKDDTLIAYERSGEGPPLVLVHGTLASHSRWVSVQPELEKHFNVYAIDRRGRGESGDAEHYALEREYEDVAAVVDSIGENVNLLGHSYGGLCVLGAALLTTNIRSLIVYEPPPVPIPDGLLDRLQSLLNSGDRAGTIATFLQELVRMPPHELERFQSSPVFPARVAAAHTIPREFQAAENYRYEPERFKHLKVPTLLLLGGESPPFAKQNVEYWHGVLPNSRIVVLPGQRHIAMDTAPDLFVREVKAFLAEPG